MRIKRLLKRIIRREDGAMTAFGLIFFVAMVMIGGLALDVANLIMVRTHLQIAADSAAHASLIAREYKTEAEAKAIGVQVAQASLPSARFGDTIKASDIQFGEWDDANDQFRIDSSSRLGVLVSTNRLATRGNAVASFFLQFLGYQNMDVVTEAAYETYYPTCMREGFVAQDRVDVQSNNLYTTGFCIHSNSHVEINNNNTFENGVIVSMPNTANLTMPSDGFTKNPGLERALRSGAYSIRILQRIDDMILSYDDASSKWFNSNYMKNNPKKNNMAPGNLDETNWQVGEIHVFDCGSLGSFGGGAGNGNGNGGNGNGGNGNGNGNGGGGNGGGNNAVKIPSGTTLVRGVIYTDCEIDIGANAILEDVLILSESVSLDAIQGRANVTLGRNDGCLAGGGVQIITKGGFTTSAAINIYGGQIIAMQKIDFEANANGIEGVSMISGGEIDSTSNMQMGFCNGAGMEHTFQADYFRLVR